MNNPEPDEKNNIPNNEGLIQNKITTKIKNNQPNITQSKNNKFGSMIKEIKDEKGLQPNLKKDKVTAESQQNFVTIEKSLSNKNLSKFRRIITAPKITSYYFSRTNDYLKGESPSKILGKTILVKGMLEGDASAKNIAIKKSIEMNIDSTNICTFGMSPEQLERINYINQI